MSTAPEDNVPAPINGPGGEAAGSGTQQEFNSEQKSADIPADSGIDPTALSQESRAENLSTQPNIDQPLFYAYTQPPARRPVRIPHFGHVLLLSLLIAFAAGILGLGLGVASALGWKIPAASATDLQFSLLGEAAIYFATLALSVIVFPPLWHKSYFAGLEWRGAVVRSRLWILVGIALICFALAFLDQAVMPGPSNAPIEKMFSSPSAAWLMFVFGITIAPFFEEMFFRGFLLPAMCTIADWTDESLFARPELTISHEERSALSIPAMIFVCGASVGVPTALVYSTYGVLTSTGHHRAAIFSIAVILGAGVYGSLGAMRSNAADEQIRLDAAGHPQWSMAAMIIGSLATSLPFALLHVEQQGRAIGPFLLLIVVSLILCAVRLITRSLAASTLVHATYNFFIFVIELAATGGFRHFDKI